MKNPDKDDSGFSDKPLKVKNVIFQSNPDREVWIKDSSTIIPYKFSCSNCQEGTFTIELKDDFYQYWTYSDGNSPNIDKDEIIKLGGGGQFYIYTACENCASVYYLGIGMIEPNNGRTVFVLHCIWEVEEC